MQRTKKNIIVLIVILGFAFTSFFTFLPSGNSPSYAAVVSGMQPYLMGVTTNSVWVMVECDSTATAYVDYGLTSSYGSTATTTSNQASGGGTYVHNIKVTGLTANKTYHYRVRQGTSTSADYTFSTAVNPGTNFRFAFAADQRTGIGAHDKIALQIKNFNPRFSLYGGDICDTDTYTSLKNEFFTTNERALIAEVPFFNAPGNHESWTAVMKAFTSGPANNASNDPDYYSFDYGDAHFVMVNNEVAFTAGSAQYNFVRDDLMASTKPWKIVFSHVPAYCAGGHNENASMKAMTTNIFEPYGVDMVLSGHSHFYQHNLVNGIQHMVIGAAGVSPDTSMTTAAYTQEAIVDNCFGMFDITPTKLHLDVYNEDGTKLDTIDLYQGNPPSPTATPAPTPAPVPTTIVPLGATWKYLDNGSNQGTAWTATSFNDGSWSSGPAPLGYGTSGLGTTVSYGPNSADRYETTYFRKSFNISNPSSYTGLTFNIVRDDGAVAYLNGHEIARSNMPSGDITYTTLSVTNGNPTTYYEYYVNPSLLVSGTNVLAVELHQQSITSSDTFVNMELTGFTNTSTPPPTTPPPTSTPTPTPGAGADLIVTNISWSPVSPAAGNDVRFTANVKNQGTAATPGGTIIGVAFQIDGGPTTFWSDTYTTSLAAGETVILTVNGGTNGSTWSAVSGTHSVLAWVDDVDRIAESDNSNNTRTESVVVSGGTATPTPTPTPAPTPTPGGQVVLDNCNSTTDWSGTDAVSLDTVDKKEGTASLQKTGIGTSWFRKVFATSVNSGVTEANGYLHMWLYVSDATKLGSGQVEISSSGASDINEYNWALNSTNLVTGWNELNLKISDATKTGTPNLSAINFVRAYSTLTASVTCKIDNIYFHSVGGTPTPSPTPTPVPKIVLDNCNSVTDWTGTDAVTLDTTNKKEGTGSLTKTGSGTSWFRKVFATPVNSGVTEANGYLHMWLYVSDVTKLSTGGQIEITSSGASDTNEYNWSMTGLTLVNGWNELNLKISDASKLGTPSLTAINFVRVYNALTASVTCKVDDLYFYNP